MEVVGVTRNARYGRLTDDFRPILFFTYDQGYPEPRQMVYALRANGDPLVHASAVREILRQADPRVAISNIRTQAALIDQSINQEIVFARLCTGFRDSRAGNRLRGPVWHGLVQRFPPHR
jgi:hypothetical protein